MGRIFPKTLVDFYEPRAHRDWLRQETAGRTMSRRDRLMIRLLFVLLPLQMVAPHYTRWWIAGQTPGATVPSIWRIHLVTVFTFLVIYFCWHTIVWFHRTMEKWCRVRVRMTDQFIQRFQGNGGPTVFWKHAERATVRVVSHGADTWAVLAIGSKKRKNPIRVGIPHDQPIEPIIQVLSEYRVPVVMDEATAA